MTPCDAVQQPRLPIREPRATNHEPLLPSLASRSCILPPARLLGCPLPPRLLVHIKYKGRVRADLPLLDRKGLLLLVFVQRHDVAAFGMTETLTDGLRWTDRRPTDPAPAKHQTGKPGPWPGPGPHGPMIQYPMTQVEK